MFDIGFTELLLVGVVALIVVGPERLPGLVRTVLSYIRQFKSGFEHVRSEVERELELDELKQQMQDSKSHLKQAAGYDELDESLSTLRQESEKLRHIADDGFEYAEKPKTVSNTQIEADMQTQDEGPQLPSPDEHADTGIESELPHVDKESADNQGKTSDDKTSNNA